MIAILGVMLAELVTGEVNWAEFFFAIGGILCLLAAFGGVREFRYHGGAFPLGVAFIAAGFFML
jgi:uncharacterized membrane protein